MDLNNKRDSSLNKMSINILSIKCANPLIISPSWNKEKHLKTTIFPEYNHHGSNTIEKFSDIMPTSNNM